MIRYWIHALTPVHVGTGRGLGYIDLPISREKVTNWPYIPGSSIKGVIADHFGASDENRLKDIELKAAFGTSGNDDSNAAGAMVFSDANIFCLPIRSFYGTFAWVTSPFCLRRIGINPPDLNIDALVSNNSQISKQNKIYLEDIDLQVNTNNEIENIAKTTAEKLFDKTWQKIFVERFVIVNDDTFNFLCETGTEVNAHIRIDENTGVVVDGALWYEESLPVETILTGQIWCDRVFVQDLTPEKLFQRFCSENLNIQIGGKASTGKGQVRFIFERGN